MIHIAVGRRKRGKTTLSMYLARRSPSRVVFDPRGLVGCVTRYQTIDDIDRGFWTLTPGDDTTPAPEIVITPLDDVEQSFTYVSQHVRNVVREQPDRALTFLVDEVRFVKLQNKAFDWILRCADPGHVHVVLTCHRLVDVHPDIRGIADHFLLFQTTESNDLKLIDDQFGEDVRRRVERLDLHQFVQYDASAGETYECLDPSSWYVPLAKPGAVSSAEPLAEMPKKRSIFEKPQRLW